MSVSEAGEPRGNGSPVRPLIIAALIIVAIGALYVGAGIFVPLVLAVLVTFALAPIVHLLRKIGLPNLPAVLIAVLGAGIIIACIAYLIVTQLAHLATDIPQYQKIVSDKFRDLQKTASGGNFFSHIADAIQNFSASTAPAATPTSPAPAEPLPVRVVNDSQGPLSFALASLVTILAPLATAAIVTVFVVFLLLERDDFRDRFLKLVSRGDFHTSTMVMGEAAKRVSRYLLIQAVVNLVYGAVFGLGLFAIGIPNALLWALCTALFRYIPFVGTLIAAAIPFALAFAIDPGWTKLLETVILFFGLEIVVTNAIEPRLYGSSTGMSGLAVLVAAMFWASLWGPIGLILSTPLTVCLVVLGQYVPELKFLEIMLGSEPVLQPDEQIYQRLLSGNPEEAIEIAETYVAGHSRQEFYDDIAIPALRLAAADRARNGTDVGSRRAVAEGMSAIVAEMDTPANHSDESSEPVPVTAKVLCIGGRTELDVAAARMLAQVIGRPTLETAVLPPFTLRQEGIGQLDLAGVDVICLVYLDANPRTYVRFVKRRLRQLAPDVKIVVSTLGFEAATAEELTLSLEVDAVATTVSMAEDRILGLIGASPAGGEPKTSGPEKWLREIGRLADRQGFIERYKSGIAEAFGSSLVVLALRDGAAGDHHLPPTESLASLTAAVISGDELVVVEDVKKDHSYDANTFFLENGVQFFASAPIHAPSGEVIGCVSIFDASPRSFSASDGARLQQRADQFIALARRSTAATAPLSGA
jgi:predicted PurR-regulated permease PerM